MLTTKSKTDENLNAVYGINGKGLDRSQDTVVVKETKSATEAKTTGSLGKYSSKGSPAFKYGTQLFGLPYQFLDSVDKRFPKISKTLGRSYVEHIALQAPTIIIIPGKPKYLPGAKDKKGITNALIDAANGNFSAIKSVKQTDDDLRLYDFQTDYINTYSFINILCRTAAGFLELDHLGDSDEAYYINGKKVNFVKFDWKGYRWDGNSYKAVSDSVVGSAVKKQAKSVKKVIKGAVSKLSDWINQGTSNTKGVKLTDKEVKTDEEEMNAIEDTLRRTNYMQFYMDPDGASESKSMSNTSQQSIFKQALDSASSTSKDIQFLINSGGADAEGLEKLGTNAMNALDSTLGSTASSVNASAGSIISRLLSCGKTVIKGENIMMPDIWGGADMSESHTITCHYKAPYGNKVCEYVDVLVPVLHWVGLAYPRATTANSYASPPLIKAYVPGAWTCSLGLITALEINRSVSEGNVNNDGLYTEVDVNVTITELYSDMALSPANNPALFLNNSSLVEFLATSCGLDLLESQLDEKVSMLWNQTVELISDMPSTVMGKITEKMDEALLSFIGI